MVKAVNEISGKLSLLRSLAASHGVDALLLQRVSSVAWATSGAAAYVNTARSEGEAFLLITREKQFLFTNNIEAPRLEKEEGLITQGWEFSIAPWFETNRFFQELMGKMKVAADGIFPGVPDLSIDIAHLRANLTQVEGERFRTLGRLCAQAMASAIHFVHPGQTEFEIAGLLADETMRRGVQATVTLIATDERIFNFRHPLPTAKKLDRYAMLILCGRQNGLVCSITRSVHFGHLPEEIQKKALSVARIDAAMINATRPGRSLGEIFQTTIDEYARIGYPDEWRLHHQGGPTGYEPREYMARPGASEKVSLGQVYAWNPSITGTKSEDTILVTETGNEILTSISGWPVISVDIDGDTIERPAILIMD
jgi:antitoxin VapB